MKSQIPPCTKSQWWFRNQDSAAGIYIHTYSLPLSVVPKWHPSSGSRKHQRSFFQNHDCQFRRWIKGVCDDTELRKHERSPLLAFLLSFPSLSPLSLATDNVEEENEMIMMEKLFWKTQETAWANVPKKILLGTFSSQWMTINSTQGGLAMQLPTVSRSHRDIKAEHENIHELAVFKPPSQHTHMFPSLLTSSISLYPSWTLELHPTLVVGRLKPSFNTTHIQCKQIGSEIANLAEGVGFMMSETAEIVMWSSYLNYLNRTLKSWSS